jgi:dUTP pyrophosphatase
MILDCKLNGIGFPCYATDGSVGLDLQARLTEPNITISPGCVELISTGFSIDIPDGYAGFVFIRSSVAKRGLSLANGTGLIDSDYQGEIKLLLQNNTAEWIKIHESDRLAQLVITPICRVNLNKVDKFEPTVRGTGGFGSTGR